MPNALQRLTRPSRRRCHRTPSWTGSLGRQALVRSRIHISILLALVAAAAGCGRGPQFEAKLQAAGGAAPLKQECAGFLCLHEQTSGQQYVWMPRTTNFPPAIASFLPQAVSITRMDDVLMVDVQVTGGFDHHGLLVAPSPTPQGFRPQRGSWSIWQLADGVWEYRE